MARIRSLKPEFFSDEQLSTCSPHARLLAIAILQLCDSHGVFRNIPMQVHAHAFPWEAEVKISALLGELEAIGYVKLYEIEGKRYGLVKSFTKHQRLSGKEAQSEGMYPLPNQEKQSLTGEEAKDKASGSAEVFPEKHRDAQEQGTGNREQVNTASAKSADCRTYKTKKGRLLKGKHLETFETFWKTFAYPKGKAEAADVWFDLKPDDETLVAILRAAEAEAKRRPGIIQAGQTPKMGQGWLSGRRWEDEEFIPEQKPWHESATGITAKGNELGIVQDHDEPFPRFKDRVLAAAGL